MAGVIFDFSALITCNKPPPVSDAILEINQLFYSDIVQRVTVYLTSDILKEYKQSWRREPLNAANTQSLQGQ
jgi:hypothetical protein